jgi:hypothetical protein
MGGVGHEGLQNSTSKLFATDFTDLRRLKPLPFKTTAVILAKARIQFETNAKHLISGPSDEARTGFRPSPE